MSPAGRGKHPRNPLGDTTEVRKQQIIDFIRMYHNKNQIAPTLREIAVAIGWQPQSYGTVVPLIDDLIAKGFLKRVAKGARTIMLVEPQPKPYYYRREDTIRALKNAANKSK